MMRVTQRSTKNLWVTVGRIAILALFVSMFMHQGWCQPTSAEAVAARVQTTSGNTGTVQASSFNLAALGALPADGNTLVAVISTRSTTTNAVSSVMQTGATWSKVASTAGTAGTTTEIWYAPNVSGAGTAITVNLGLPVRAAAVVAEYTGMLTASVSDVSATATGNSSSASTGTTATTVQADELWIGGIGLVSSSYTLSTITNSFTSVTNASSTNFTSSNNARVYLLQRIVTATGTAFTGGTVSSSSQWSGAVATFKATPANNLTIGNGTNPGNANAYKNSTDNAINSFTMSMSNRTGTISTLTVTNTNSSTTNVSNIKVYRDAGVIGAYEPGTDTLVPVTISGQTATAATITFTTPESVGTSPQSYLIIYDIAGGATTGNTMTSRVTSATGNFDGTPTYNDSGSATLTVATGNLTIGNGTNPGNANAYQNSQNNAINAFTLAVSAGIGQVTSLSLVTTNSSTTNVPTIRVFRDAGTIGAFDSDTDVLVPVTASSQTSTTVTLTFVTPETVTTSPQNYLVTYEIGGSVAAGTTMTARVSNTTAATGTGLGTITYSDAGSATLTVASGILTIGNGTNPANANSYQNSTDQAINAFTFAVSAGVGKVSTLTLTNTNSSTTNVSNIKVYRDLGTVGAFDSGTDVLVPTTFTISSATAATITFTTAEIVTTTPANYLITYDIAGNATVGNTLTSRVTAATGTGLGTVTYSDTGSATLTLVTSGPLTVGNGTNPANNPNSYRGNSYAIDAFTLSVAAGFGEISTLTLTNTNSSTTNVSNIAVYRDTGIVGQFEPGTDILVPTTFSISSSTVATITFTTAEAVSTTPADYLIVYTINSTATLTNTMTSRVTTATGTGLGAIIYNDSNSATLTIASNNLTVATGTNPANANAYRGSSKAVDGFTMVMTAASSTVSTLTVTNAGTGSLQSEVSDIRIYRDAGTIGTLDGADTLVPTSFSATSATAATLTFTTPEPVGTSVQNYLVVYEIAPAAVDSTLTGRITAASGYAGVPTCNDTTSATLTIPAVGNLTVGNGTDPGDDNAGQAATGKPVNAFTLALSSGEADVNTLTLTNEGTGSLLMDVANIAVHLDAGTIGTYEPGTDTLVPSSFGFNSATGATITFNTPEHVTTTAKSYLIVFDMAPLAQVGDTLTSRIAATWGTGLGTPVYSDSASATLTVVSGICVRSAPLVSLDSYGQARPGFTKSYTIAITNKDNIYCSDSTFSIGVGSETGTTASFNLPSTVGAGATGLAPTATFSTTLNVSAKTSAAIADALTTPVTVTDSANHAAQSWSGSIITYANNPKLHNSISFNPLSTKWGAAGWGITGGQYGAFDCTTCHAAKTTNVARIKTTLTAPGGSVNFQSKELANSFGVYSTTVSSSQYICETCHTRTSYHKGTMPTVVSHTNEAQTRDCITCHKHDQGFKPIGGCTKCHSYTQRQRVAVFRQFTTGNSHHVQGVPVTDKLCYQCHWEANSDGTVNLTYHGGSLATQQPVDLVIYRNNARPIFKSQTSAVSYIANGSRSEIAKINNHCLGCHSSANGSSQPFGDNKSPQQYAWDGLSIDERYSQTGVTTWGKYEGTRVSPKKNQTKALSAHGNAAANERGWNTSETWPNTSGTQQVTCYDCHNSHGSSVAGVTSNYSSATGRNRGGILKDTLAGMGGYAMTYKPQAGGSVGNKNVYNPGAGLCFDCHNGVATGSTPWGYSDTFGAFQPIRGYWDTPYFGAPGGGALNFGAAQRYAYKASNATNKGGHFGKSSAMVTTPSKTINGLCTPCHDPHGVSPSLAEGGNQTYAVPLLKGTWMTSPYKEDVAPRNKTENRGGGYNNAVNTVGSTPLYYIDQNTFGPETYPAQGQMLSAGTKSIKWDFANTTRVSETVAQFGGLCLNCHSQSAIAPNAGGAAPTWKTMARIHNTVKGWGSAGTGNANNAAHSYTCSKCHAPHNSTLPRLMTTNCLNYSHRGQVVGPAANPVKTADINVSQKDGNGGGGGGFPSGGGGRYDTSHDPPGKTSKYYGPWFFGNQIQSATGYRNCHDNANTVDGAYPAKQLWNTKSPW